MTETHCSDTTLLAIVDGRRTGPEDARHIETCDECTRRLAELEADARTVAELFSQERSDSIPVPEFDAEFLETIAGRGATEAPVKEGRSGSHPTSDAVISISRRAARKPTALRYAALAAGIALLLMVPPVRAWVIEAVGRLTGDETPVVEAPIGVDVEGGVAIQATGRTLRLVVQGRPAEVWLMRSDEERVARISTRPSREIVALPDGFQVTGAAGAVARIWIPESTEELTLLVDGEAVWAGRVPDDLADGLELLGGTETGR